ncbi:MAG: PAS domain-containing protein [Candidatus Odinarchaeota archaeon]
MLENLPIELIELIIDTLPLEMSFIDLEDKVKYYSKGDKRIFKRTPSVIGKKVQNCHPPKSLDKVNAILNDFKNNKRDFAEFWIPLSDLFLYIRYFPVRDKEGHYLGTLEVTQEISKIQTLKGEKRLLD